jgi:hypothetical protein
VASNISGLVSSAEIWNETEKEIEIKVKIQRMIKSNRFNYVMSLTLII